jgi:hypothetical protein
MYNINVCIIVFFSVDIIIAIGILYFFFILAQKAHDRI